MIYRLKSNTCPKPCLEIFLGNLNKTILEFNPNPSLSRIIDNGVVIDFCQLVTRISPSKILFFGSLVMGFRQPPSIQLDIDMIVISNKFCNISLKKRRIYVKESVKPAPELPIDCYCYTEHEYEKISRMLQKDGLLLSSGYIELQYTNGGWNIWDMRKNYQNL